MIVGLELRSALSEKKGGLLSLVENSHTVFTNAGWSYRTNERGWVIYRHPCTGLWHTREEAEAILEAEAIFRDSRPGVYYRLLELSLPKPNEK